MGRVHGGVPEGDATRTRRRLHRLTPGELISIFVWAIRLTSCFFPLQFSPEGALLLSAAADPDGALRVWDVATGTEVLGARTEAPVASVGWCVHSRLPEFVIAGADGVSLF